MRLRFDYKDCGYIDISTAYSLSFVVKNSLRLYIWDIHWSKDLGVATDYCVNLLRKCI